VHVIVGFPPASGPDIVARLVGQRLSERLGQQFIVEDRPGAGGSIATQTVVNASADGYTLLLATTANAINATLYPNLNFNFIRDVAPIVIINRAPFVKLSTQLFRREQFLSSSPMPRLIPTRSTWHLPVSGVRPIFATSCLR
jgi:tripartite-type tricarboxylate transporter receptor subunit TctC